jgi:hypothetical protein
VHGRRVVDQRRPVVGCAISVGYAGSVATGVWRSLVARFVRDEEAVGSNPATPTNREIRRSLVGLSICSAVSLGIWEERFGGRQADSDGSRLPDQ